MKPIWLLFAGVIVTVLAIGVFAFCAEVSNYKEPKDVEDQFRENLPQHATREDVERMLAMGDIRFDVTDAEHSSRLRELGIAPDVVAVRARVRGERGFFVDQDFIAYFLLDEHNLVTRIIVTEILTGL